MLTKLVVPGEAAEGGAWSGAQQPEHDVGHDESAGSRHGETSRHGAAGGKTQNLFELRYLLTWWPLPDLVMFVTHLAPPPRPHILCLVVSSAALQRL